MNGGESMNPITAAKNMGVKYNVTFRVVDRYTNQVVQEVIGHNSATNSLMMGIGHYLKGDGVLNQGYEMLSQFVPRYISLGTMGLLSQDQDSDGLPTGIGVTSQESGESDEEYEIRRYTEYMNQVPGYGADGYDPNQNNGRAYLGLGPMYSSGAAVKCELITESFPRVEITYRDILPEAQAEIPQTIDVIFSGYISTGALAQFRNGGDHLFITECGLWNRKNYRLGANNGMLAGYRIVPPNSDNWDMEKPENRRILQENILRVGKNQVVQVIWKIQIGSADQLGGLAAIYRELYEQYMKVLINTTAGGIYLIADGFDADGGMMWVPEV